jgi:hydroxypyruvate isomerase
MPRFAANLSMLYPELPFLDRFAAAARDGFEGVEYLFPYEHAPEELAARLQAARPAAGAVQRAAGRLGRGRARPGLPAGREEEFRAGIARRCATRRCCAARAST